MLPSNYVNFAADDEFARTDAAGIIVKLLLNSCIGLVQKQLQSI